MQCKLHEGCDIIKGRRLIGIISFIFCTFFAVIAFIEILMNISAENQISIILIYGFLLIFYVEAAFLNVQLCGEDYLKNLKIYNIVSGFLSLFCIVDGGMKLGCISTICGPFIYPPIMFLFAVVNLGFLTVTSSLKEASEKADLIKLRNYQAALAEQDLNGTDELPKYGMNITVTRNDQ